MDGVPERGVPRLYVGNLVVGISDVALRRTLSRFGTVRALDRRPGYAHVSIVPADDTALDRCVSTLHRTKWQGAELRVERASEHYLTRLRKEWDADTEESKERTAATVAAAAAAAEAEGNPVRSTGGDYDGPHKGKWKGMRVDFSDSNFDDDNSDNYVDVDAFACEDVADAFEASSKASDVPDSDSCLESEYDADVTKEYVDGDAIVREGDSTNDGTQSKNDENENNAVDRKVRQNGNRNARRDLYDDFASPIGTHSGSVPQAPVPIGELLRSVEAATTEQAAASDIFAVLVADQSAAKDHLAAAAADEAAASNRLELAVQAAVADEEASAEAKAAQLATSSTQDERSSSRPDAGARRGKKRSARASAADLAAKAENDAERVLPLTTSAAVEDAAARSRTEKNVAKAAEVGTKAAALASTMSLFGLAASPQPPVPVLATTRGNRERPAAITPELPKRLAIKLLPSAGAVPASSTKRAKRPRLAPEDSEYDAAALAAEQDPSRLDTGRERRIARAVLVSMFPMELTAAAPGEVPAAAEIARIADAIRKPAHYRILLGIRANVEATKLRVSRKGSAPRVKGESKVAAKLFAKYAGKPTCEFRQCSVVKSNGKDGEMLSLASATALRGPRRAGLFREFFP
jgi:hypothetical protein